MGIALPGVTHAKLEKLPVMSMPMEIRYDDGRGTMDKLVARIGRSGFSCHALPESRASPVCLETSWLGH